MAVAMAKTKASVEPLPSVILPHISQPFFFFYLRVICFAKSKKGFGEATLEKPKLDFKVYICICENAQK